jgi:hypothetical protein
MVGRCGLVTSGSVAGPREHGYKHSGSMKGGDFLD